MTAAKIGARCKYCGGTGEIPALGYDAKGCFDPCYKCNGPGVAKKAKSSKRAKR